MKKWINLLKNGMKSESRWVNTGQTREVTLSETTSLRTYVKEHLFLNRDTQETEWRKIDELVYQADKALVNVPKP